MHPNPHEGIVPVRSSILIGLFSQYANRFVPSKFPCVAPRVMGHGDVLVTDKIYVHNDYDVLRKSMGYGEKSGTSVVQVSYGRKFKVRQAKKKAAQTTE